MASGRRGDMYIGVTSNLSKRYYQHNQKVIEGYSKLRSTIKLVYYEQFGTMELAILREKQLKNWHRDWKINLIEQHNLNWEDLGPELDV